MINRFFLRNKPKLVQYIIASLALPSIALYVWVQYPSSIKQISSRIFLSSSPINPTVSQHKERISDADLEDFFAHFFVDTISPDQSALLASLYAAIPPQTHWEEGQGPLTWAHIPPHTYDISSYVSDKDHIPYSPHRISFPAEQAFINNSFSIPSLQTALHSLPAIPDTQSPLSSDSLAISHFVQPSLQAVSSINHTAPHFIALSTISPEFHLHVENHYACPFSYLPLDNHIGEAVFQLLSTINMASIDEHLPIHTLYHMQWNEGFSITPSVFMEDGGYVFALSISPKEQCPIEKVRQNLYFLVDVSSDIENHKIAIFKKSVLKALSCLQPGDRFNIFLLDKKIRSFSTQSVPFSFHTLRQAEAFLEKRHERAVFSTFDLFQGLSQALDLIDQGDELHTALLLTNGKLPHDGTRIQKSLSQLIKKNGEKLSLFTAAVGKNNDLVNLDLLSSVSGGKLIYSDTHAAFPRKLSSFVKTLRDPIAKNIQLSLSSSDQKAEIFLSPRISQTQSFYSSSPLIIMGKTSRLCPMAISLQGKNEEGWVLIQKEVDFSHAQEASFQVKKEWTLQQVSSLYQQFLKDGDLSHLRDAKHLLKIAHGRMLGE